MLLNKKSVSELLECSIEKVDSEIKDKNLNTVEIYGETKVEYNSLIKYFINQNCYEIKYFDTKKECISDYLYDTQIKEISDYNSVVMNKYTNENFIQSNTFVVNPIVNKDKFEFQSELLEKKGFSESNIDKITDMLVSIFPTNRLEFFNEIILNTQFQYNESIVSISDYSIIEFNGIIIVFHLDLHNGLKTTINSMWLKKDFPLSIPIPTK